MYKHGGGWEREHVRVHSLLLRFDVCIRPTMHGKGICQKSSWGGCSNLPHTCALEDLAKISTKVAFLSVKPMVALTLAMVRTRNKHAGHRSRFLA